MGEPAATRQTHLTVLLAPSCVQMPPTISLRARSEGSYSEADAEPLTPDHRASILAEVDALGDLAPSALRNPLGSKPSNHRISGSAQPSLKCRVRGAGSRPQRSVRKATAGSGPRDCGTVLQAAASLAARFGPVEPALVGRARLEVSYKP